MQDLFVLISTVLCSGISTHSLHYPHLSTLSVTYYCYTCHSRYQAVRSCCSVILSQIFDLTCLHTEPDNHHNDLFHNDNASMPGSNSVADCPCTSVHISRQFHPSSHCSLGSPRMLSSDRGAVVAVCLVIGHCDRRMYLLQIFCHH